MALVIPSAVADWPSMLDVLGIAQDPPEIESPGAAESDLLPDTGAPQGQGPDDGHLETALVLFTRTNSEVLAEFLGDPSVALDLVRGAVEQSGLVNLRPSQALDERLSRHSGSSDGSLTSWLWLPEEYGVRYLLDVVFDTQSPGDIEGRRELGRRAMVVNVTVAARVLDLQRLQDLGYVEASGEAPLETSAPETWALAFDRALGDFSERLSQLRTAHQR